MLVKFDASIRGSVRRNSFGSVPAIFASALCAAAVLSKKSLTLISRMIPIGWVGGIANVESLRSDVTLTLGFFIAVLACAINERQQRTLEYRTEEVVVLEDILKAVTLRERIDFAEDHEGYPVLRHARRK